MKKLTYAISVITVSACTSFVPTTKDVNTTPTRGETFSANTYVPLDGLAIDQVMTADSCKEAPKKPEFRSLVQSLPDISVRFAVAQTSGNGNLGFGPVAVTSEGLRYRAVLDYVNNDAVPVTFQLRQRITSQLNGERNVWPIGEPLPPDFSVVGYDARLTDSTSENATIARLSQLEELNDTAAFQSITIPVYVGIGLRVTADVVALKGGIAIASLGGIGVNAESLRGGLTVQSIGISGSLVSGAIPTPSKLDQTTIENAILAIGSGRTAIYANSSDDDKVSLTPRIVGLYSPIGTDPSLINAIYSELAKSRIQWRRPCI